MSQNVLICFRFADHEKEIQLPAEGAWHPAAAAAAAAAAAGAQQPDSERQVEV